VESQVNQGTKCTIYLPAISRTCIKTATAAPDLPASGSGTLLVVDDEPYILNRDSER